MVNPRGPNNINVPINDTGMANTQISVARQLCRNRNTTNITNINASINVCTTSLMDAFTTDTVSKRNREIDIFWKSFPRDPQVFLLIPGRF